MKSTAKGRQYPSAMTELSELLKQVKKRDASVRISTLESLAKIDHPCVLDVVVVALSDKNPTVRVTAAESLGLLKNKRGITPLLHRLTDSNYEVRMRATESLGILLKGKRSPLALIKRLQDSDELVRITAVEALELIGDKKALPTLWKMTRDQSPLVRSYAAEAIGKLGGERDIPRFQKLLKQETSDRAKVGFFYALYVLGQDTVLKDLLLLLRSSDYRARCATANRLSEIPMDESEKEIILRALRRALRVEPTVAARSCIRSNLRGLGK